MVDENDNYISEEQIEDTIPQGEPLASREDLIATIFNTQVRLELMKHRLRGDEESNGFWKPTKNGLAPDDFILKQSWAMESIIDTVNSISRKNDVETKKILHEAVRSFILDFLDEEFANEKDMRTLSKAYEHSLELFLGIVEFGHGSNVLKDVSAGLNSNFNPQDKNKGFLGWLK